MEAASYLPALIPALDKFISTGRFSTVTDDLESENDFNQAARYLTKQAEELRKMASSCRDDPKLDSLLKIVSETIHSEGAGKVLIFSYFLHTLSYLEKHLQKRGCRVAVIEIIEVDDDVGENMRKISYKQRKILMLLMYYFHPKWAVKDLTTICSRLVNMIFPGIPCE